MSTFRDIPFGLRIGVRCPVDQRFTYDTIAARNTDPTTYEGLITVVEDKVYLLTDESNRGNNSGWTELALNSVSGTSYDASTGILTLTFTDGTTFSTSDLRGADGQDGTNGTNGTNGTDGQDGTNGEDGNGIVSTSITNGVLTLNFTDGSTFSTNNLTGPAGPTGAAGADGDDGTDGAAGVSITNVQSSRSGSNTILTISFSDNRQAVTVSIPDGAAGAPGSNGSDGADGARGAAGADGTDGTNGRGISTITTLKTTDNTRVTISYTDSTPNVTFDVPDGVDGDDGTDGRTILSGQSVPDGSIGSNGDFYIHLETNGRTLFGPKTNGAWGTGIDLVGNDGQDGTIVVANPGGTGVDLTSITIGGTVYRIAGGGGGLSTVVSNDTLSGDGSTDAPLSVVKVDFDNKVPNNSFWEGTLADYDALVTKDPNTIYNITDDFIASGAIGGTDQFTSQQALENFITDKAAFRADIGAGTSTDDQFSNQQALEDFISDKPAFRSDIGAGTSSLALGTSSTTALAGNTTTISSTQATAITNNTAKRTYPAADQTKVAGIEAGAEVNVQADWDATTGDAFIDNKPTTITTAQANAITVNSAKAGITTGQVNAIAANTAKVGITTAQASAISTNTNKTGITTAQATAIASNSDKVGITTDQANAIADNTSKVGITTEQADAITANTAKTGVTTAQSNAIVANTAKTGITTAQTNAIVANTEKIGITTAQAGAITANTAKVGITPAQATAITNNTAKVGVTTAQATAITNNTAKTGITTAQANAITANTAKVGVSATSIVGGNNITVTTTNDGVSIAGADGITTASTDDTISGNGAPVSVDTGNYFDGGNVARSTSGGNITYVFGGLNAGGLPEGMTRQTLFTAGRTITISTAGGTSSGVIESITAPANASFVSITITGETGFTQSASDTDLTAAALTDERRRLSVVYGTSANTALEGNTTIITPAQATAITNNSAKVSFPGFGTTSTTALAGNTSIPDPAILRGGGIPALGTGVTAAEVRTLIGAGTSSLGLGTSSTTALAGNTTTITSDQADAITANTAKTGITTAQASAITTNTAKVGITTAQASAITTNTAKVGITTAQANAIASNTSKTGITTDQADAITANTAKTGITGAQATAIVANTAKTSFPGFGTSSTTALRGDTSIPTVATYTGQQTAGNYTVPIRDAGFATTTKFLREDGDWVIPTDTNTQLTSTTILPVLNAATGTIDADLLGTEYYNQQSALVNGELVTPNVVVTEPAAGWKPGFVGGLGTHLDIDDDDGQLIRINENVRLLYGTTTSVDVPNTWRVTFGIGESFRSYRNISGLEQTGVTRNTDFDNRSVWISEFGVTSVILSNNAPTSFNASDLHKLARTSADRTAGIVRFQMIPLPSSSQPLQTAAQQIENLNYVRRVFGLTETSASGGATTYTQGANIGHFSLTFAVSGGGSASLRTDNATDNVVLTNPTFTGTLGAATAATVNGTMVVTSPSSAVTGIPDAATGIVLMNIFDEAARETDDIVFAAGENITISNSDNVLTFSSSVADDAVTTDKIADDAVTSDKLANSINTSIAANTAKVGITPEQASAITANTAKVIPTLTEYNGQTAEANYTVPNRDAGNTTTKFLREDGDWIAPPLGVSVSRITIGASTNATVQPGVIAQITLANGTYREFLNESTGALTIASNASSIIITPTPTDVTDQFSGFTPANGWGPLGNAPTVVSTYTGQTAAGNYTIPVRDSGDTSTKFLREDGDWIIPTDTNTQLTSSNILGVLNGASGTINGDLLPDLSFVESVTFATEALRNASTRTWAQGDLAIITTSPIESFIYTGTAGAGPAEDTDFTQISDTDTTLTAAQTLARLNMASGSIDADLLGNGLQLGTSSTTALAGNTTTISTAQANAIVANTAKTGITTAQSTAITNNTAKVGITTAQATAITNNTAKVSFPGLGTSSTTALAGNTTTITSDQADAITANTAKVGITTGQANAIVANTAKVGITTAQATAIANNTAKTGITGAQATAITNNTAKVGITTAQASAITTNTAKVSFPGLGTSSTTALAGNTTTISDTQASAITTNSAKVGITGAQATAITNNTAKVGITPAQATAITNNTAKVGITTAQASAITTNTAKVGITTAQAGAITANTAKTTFPGFGTTSSTALVGNTFIPVVADYAGQTEDGNYTVPVRDSGNTTTKFLREDGDWVIPTTSSGGLSAVSTNATIDGDGTTGSPLGVASSITSAVTANTAKTSFPGFGSTSTTALASVSNGAAVAGQNVTGMTVNSSGVITLTRVGASSTGLSSIGLSDLTFQGATQTETVTIFGEVGTMFNLAVDMTTPTGWLTSGALGATSGTIPAAGFFTTTLTIPASTVTVNRTARITATNSTDTENVISTGLFRQQFTQQADGDLMVSLSGNVTGMMATFSATISAGDAPFSLSLFDTNPGTGSPTAIQTATVAGAAPQTHTFTAIDTTDLTNGEHTYYVRVTDNDGDIVVASEAITVANAQGHTGVFASAIDRYVYEDTRQTHTLVLSPYWPGGGTTTDWQGQISGITSGASTATANLTASSSLAVPSMDLNGLSSFNVQLTQLEALRTTPGTLILTNRLTSPNSQFYNSSITAVRESEATLDDYQFQAIGTTSNGFFCRLNTRERNPELYTGISVVGYDYITSTSSTVPVGSNRITASQSSGFAFVSLAAGDYSVRAFISTVNPPTNAAGTIKYSDVIQFTRT